MIENLPIKLNQILANFGIIGGSVGQISDGPLVTDVEYKLPEGTPFSRIQKFERDIGRELGITGVRISEIPNSVYIQIEVPQAEPQSVAFGPILYSAEFLKANYALPICLGVDMRGNPIMKDLSKMPHLLVAGTTGSGKSVGLNSFIVSLIHKKTPQELQFVLIDPKRIEFSVYNNQKYMLRPVITDMNIASICLSQLVGEMNNRYTLFEQQTVRNIAEYNAKANVKLPYIVCVIDEFADLIMFDKSVEQQVQMLAQKSRAAGIHLIIATQRPSVDVITGSLKANLPTRLSYKVASPADSITILNTTGAETLIGRGDSLFLEENGTLTRILGAFISDSDIENALAPYRCQMPKQTTAYELEQAKYAEQKEEQKKSAASKKSGGFFVWICDMWNRLGVRNQTKIIKAIFSLLVGIMGIKSTNTPQKSKTTKTLKQIGGSVIKNAIKPKAQYYKWLPSTSKEQNPEHALLYGKVFKIGTGDKDGYMPGERNGCHCGMKILTDEEIAKIKNNN